MILGLLANPYRYGSTDENILLNIRRRDGKKWEASKVISRLHGIVYDSDKVIEREPDFVSSSAKQGKNRAENETEQKENQKGRRTYR